MEVQGKDMGVEGEFAKMNDIKNKETISNTKTLMLHHYNPILSNIVFEPKKIM